MKKFTYFLSAFAVMFAFSSCEEYVPEPRRVPVIPARETNQVLTTVVVPYETIEDVFVFKSGEDVIPNIDTLYLTGYTTAIDGTGYYKVTTSSRKLYRISEHTYSIDPPIYVSKDVSFDGYISTIPCNEVYCDGNTKITNGKFHSQGVSPVQQYVSEMSIRYDSDKGVCSSVYSLYPLYNSYKFGKVSITDLADAVYNPTDLKIELITAAPSYWVRGDYTSGFTLAFYDIYDEGIIDMTSFKPGSNIYHTFTQMPSSSHEAYQFIPDTFSTPVYLANVTGIKISATCHGRSFEVTVTDQSVLEKLNSIKNNTFDNRAQYAYTINVNIKLQFADTDGTSIYVYNLYDEEVDLDINIAY